MHPLPRVDELSPELDNGNSRLLRTSFSSDSNLLVLILQIPEQPISVRWDMVSISEWPSWPLCAEASSSNRDSTVSRVVLFFISSSYSLTL